MSGNGIFITFEGGDGSGKTTQAAALASRLLMLGLPVVRTYEPGGTLLGNTLRSLLLDAQFNLQPLTQVLLFSAAREENVETVIRPSLQAGRIVICDRFTDSTVAYQGFGKGGHDKGVDMETIFSLNEIATGGLVPDLTILLDIDPEVALSRVSESEPDGDQIGGHLQLGFDLGEPLDGHKRQGGWEIDVHRKIRAGYLALAASDEDRFLVLDSTLPPSQLSEMIWERVKAMLDARATQIPQTILPLEMRAP